LAPVDVQVRSMKPYKVCWYDFAAYNVVDREHGDRVGFVLAAYKGWDAMSLVPHHRFIGNYRLRRDAVEAVWEARKP